MGQIATINMTPPANKNTNQMAHLNKKQLLDLMTIEILTRISSSVRTFHKNKKIIFSSLNDINLKPIQNIDFEIPPIPFVLYLFGKNLTSFTDVQTITSKTDLPTTDFGKVFSIYYWIYLVYAFLKPFTKKAKQAPELPKITPEPFGKQPDLKDIVTKEAEDLGKTLEKLRPKTEFDLNIEARLERESSWLKERQRQLTFLERLYKFLVELSRLVYYILVMYGYWWLLLLIFLGYLSLCIFFTILFSSFQLPPWLVYHLYLKYIKTSNKYAKNMQSPFAKTLVEYLKRILFYRKSVLKIAFINVILGLLVVLSTYLLKFLDTYPYGILFRELTEANCFLPLAKNFFSILVSSANMQNLTIIHLYLKAFLTIGLFIPVKMLIIYNLLHIGALLIIGLKRFVHLIIQKGSLKEKRIQEEKDFEITRVEKGFLIAIVWIYSYYVGFESFYKL